MKAKAFTAMAFLFFMVVACKKEKNETTPTTHSLTDGDWQLDSTLDKKGVIYDYIKGADEQVSIGFNIKDSLLIWTQTEPGQPIKIDTAETFYVKVDSMFIGDGKKAKSKFTITGNVLLIEGTLLEMPKSWLHFK
jgi:hypothetical protein